MEKIIIIGKGGHARSIVDVIEREGKYQIIGYVVNESIDRQKQEDYPIVGDDSNLVELYEAGIHYAAIGIGYLGKGNLRRKLSMHLKEIGYTLPAICDPSAIVSLKARIGEGTFVGKGVIINSGVSIGALCIVNNGAIIEHDCHVGDFSHISVGTILCGGVCVGTEAFVGANATVIQGITIGNRAVIGAGEVLKENIGNNVIYHSCKILGGGYGLKFYGNMPHTVKSA